MESNRQSGTTSISQLPIHNQMTTMDQVPQNPNMVLNTNPGTNNNIILTKNEVISESTSQMQNTQMPQMPQIAENPQSQNTQMPQTQNNYNELISQLQRASANGATGLPSRDIPMDTKNISDDVEIKPNFIPQPPRNDDYINNMQTPENLIMQNNREQTNIDRLDAFYNEFQLPLLISILYFLFQLPIFRRMIKKVLPSLFGQDGNPNLYGYFFNSLLFSSLFYILLKVINQLTMSVIS